MERLQKCNLIPIASRSGIEQDNCDPVNCTSENANRVFNTANPKDCDVLNLNGVYHARLTLSPDEHPILIALHGICTETEAQQALQSIINIRGAGQNVRVCT